jgi:hypothetical protein
LCSKRPKKNDKAPGVELGAFVLEGRKVFLQKPDSQNKPVEGAALNDALCCRTLNIPICAILSRPSKWRQLGEAIAYSVVSTR